MVTTPNVQKGTPGKLLLGFSLLVLLAAAAAIEDWSHRDEIEEFEFPTGLQDDQLFPSRPDGFVLENPIVHIDGQPFYSTRRQPVERGDDIMLRGPMDDSGKWFIYQYGKEILRGKASEVDPTKDQSIYLKVDHGSYLELSESPQSDVPAIPTIE